MEEIDYLTFQDNDTIQRSVVFSFIIIGEASTKIIHKYPDFIRKHPQISWQAMKGMRNQLAHGYFSINLQIVWNTIHSELPKLEEQIKNILNDL